MSLIKQEDAGVAELTVSVLSESFQGYDDTPEQDVVAEFVNEQQWLKEFERDLRNPYWVQRIFNADLRDEKINAKRLKQASRDSWFDPDTASTSVKNKTKLATQRSITRMLCRVDCVR